MSEIILTEHAYCKMILHAVKYPHCSVNGVLLVNSKQYKENSKKIVYVEAIPLFHLCLFVTPMIEVALTQISTYAQNKGLTVAGYYLANENIGDVSYEKPYQSRIAEKIAEYFPAACLVVLNNKKIETMSMSTLFVCQNSDGKWKNVNKNNIFVGEEILQATLNLISRNASNSLVDFDNHLDKLSLDWSNVELNKIIDEEIKSV